MLRILYNIVYVLSVFAAAILFAVSNPRRFIKEFRDSFKERLGFYPNINADGVRPLAIIRCASLGETKIALRLIDDGLKKDFFVVLTVGTQSARDFALSNAESGVLVVYTPPDFFFFVRNFFKFYKNPACVMFVESDLWPEFVWQASESGARVILVNGRLSPRTASAGRTFRKIFMKVLSSIDRFLTRYPSDAAAFKKIGVPVEKIFVSGNVKYDFSRGAPENFNGRASFGYRDSDFILVAGSVHRADEIMLNRALESLKEDLGDDEFFSRFRTVIVPRHIERAASETLRIFSSFNPVLYSSARKNKTPFAPSCLVVDSVGLLEKFYALCDAAFIGGSFGSRGGQEPMSAAHLGKPVIYGPNMTKFSDETARLESSGGAFKVSNEEELKDTIKKLFSNPSLAVSVGQKAQSASHPDNGSSQRTIKAIKDFVFADKKSRADLNSA